MLLVYDLDNVLHITNDKGLRWNYDKTQKPQFGFEYDSLFYNPFEEETNYICLLYTSPSPRDRTRSRMPSSA